MNRSLKPFEYFEAKTVEQAVKLLSSYGAKAKVLAGGTDLLVSMKNKKVSPQYVVYIKGIPELNYIKYSQKAGLKIGSTAILQSIADSPTIKEKFGVLAAACSKIGTPQVRNMGTIGGNLCQDTKCLNYARIDLKREPSCYRAGGNVCYAVKGAKRCQAMAIGETAPALICLDAKASICGPTGERTLSLEDFFVSSGIVDLQEGEMLSGIEIPNPKRHTEGAYLRHSMRGALGFALAGVAVLLTVNNGVCRDARIGLLGVARIPIRARKAEELLKGEKIKDNLVDQVARVASTEASPLGDIFGSTRFRREMVKVLSKRAIKDVWQRIN